MKNKDILEIIERNKKYNEDIARLNGTYEALDDLAKSSVGEEQYKYIKQKGVIGSLLNEVNAKYEEWLSKEVE